MKFDAKFVESCSNFQNFDTILNILNQVTRAGCCNATVYRDA